MINNPRNCPRSLTQLNLAVLRRSWWARREQSAGLADPLRRLQLRPAGVSELGSVRTTGWRDDRLADDAGR